jgi:hypothetical protein
LRERLTGTWIEPALLASSSSGDLATDYQLRF